MSIMTDKTLCGCGCGTEIEPVNKKGRPKKFAVGHGARIFKYNEFKNYIPPKKKRCTKCYKNLLINKFYSKTYTSKTTGEKYKRYRSECISCCKKIIKKYRADNKEEVLFRKRKSRFENSKSIRFHVQERISGWRKKLKIKSDLDVDYLVNLYYQQKGLCYYSGTLMIFGESRGGAKFDSLSLDRLDSKKGYIKGNVVWCSYLVNTMKQSMSEMEFYNFIKNILQISALRLNNGKTFSV